MASQLEETEAGGYRTSLVPPSPSPTEMSFVAGKIIAIVVIIHFTLRVPHECLPRKLHPWEQSPVCSALPPGWPSHSRCSADVGGGGGRQGLGLSREGTS